MVKPKIPSWKKKTSPPDTTRVIKAMQQRFFFSKKTSPPSENKWHIWLFIDLIFSLFVLVLFMGKYIRIVYTMFVKYLPIKCLNLKEERKITPVYWYSDVLLTVVLSHCKPSWFHISKTNIKSKELCNWCVMSYDLQAAVVCQQNNMKSHWVSKEILKSYKVGPWPRRSLWSHPL